MGWTVRAYSAAELRHVAMPGRVGSTLFWVLPVGEWDPWSVKPWWDAFTARRGTLFHDLGLFLAHEEVRRMDREPDPVTDLLAASPGLGASLSALFPRWREDRRADLAERGSGILVLAASYPQPGWGLWVETPGACGPDVYERCFQKAVREASTDEEREQLRFTNRIYRDRKRLRREPDRMNRLRELCGMLERILAPDALSNGDKLLSDLKEVGDLVVAGVEGSTGHPEGWLEDLEGRICTLRWRHGWRDRALISQLTTLLEESGGDGLGQAIAIAQCPHTELKGMAKAFRFYRKLKPNLTPPGVGAWLEGDFIPGIREEIRRLHEPVLSESKQKLHDEERRFRATELHYRQRLTQAIAIQSRIGPGFLMSLERAFKQEGIATRNIVWDGARMVGWKVKAAIPEITNEDFIAAVNSVLGPMALHPGPGPTEATGSTFADYAYYVAMTAEKLSPWKATRELVSRLLSIPQIRRLLGAENADVPGAGLPELAGQLIEAWGWTERGGKVTTPLRACLKYGPGDCVTLDQPVSEVRISFESFLKDLVRLSFQRLGWHGNALDRELATHCPRFRRNCPGSSWADEMRRLSAGPALILLEGILPLAFPGMNDAIEFPVWIQNGHDLLQAFNAYCHENPPAAPDVAQRREWGANLERLITELETVVTELPWHLKVVQVFDQDPCVVSGHAWSHSHPEERFLRVLLPDHDDGRKELILWNPGLGNPILTDAVVLGA